MPNYIRRSPEEAARLKIERRSKKEEKRARQMLAYAHRNELLVAMGFKSYQSYLRSDVWKSIRATVLERDGCRCRSCGRDAKHVHHTRYTLAVLRGQDNAGLISLCAGCHKSIEFSRRDGKTTINEANRYLRRRQKRKARDMAWKDDPEFRSIMRQIVGVRKNKAYPNRQETLIDLHKQKRKIIQSKVRDI